MSVKHYYEKATNNYKKCRVCGKTCEEEELRNQRGRCRNCDYKNLEPVE